MREPCSTLPLSCWDPFSRPPLVADSAATQVLPGAEQPTSSQPVGVQRAFNAHLPLPSFPLVGLS